MRDDSGVHWCPRRQCWQRGGELRARALEAGTRGRPGPKRVARPCACKCWAPRARFPRQSRALGYRRSRNCWRRAPARTRHFSAERTARRVGRADARFRLSSRRRRAATALVARPGGSPPDARRRGRRARGGGRARGRARGRAERGCQEAPAPPSTRAPTTDEGSDRAQPPASSHPAQARTSSRFGPLVDEGLAAELVLENASLHSRERPPGRGGRAPPRRAPRRAPSRAGPNGTARLRVSSSSPAARRRARAARPRARGRTRSASPVGRGGTRRARRRGGQVVSERVAGTSAALADPAGEVIAATAATTRARGPRCRAPPAGRPSGRSGRCFRSSCGFTRAGL